MMATGRSPIKSDILTRVRGLYVFFILTGAAIVGKILYTQYGPEGAELRRKAAEVIYAREKVPAMRGDILARDGRILATTVPLFDVRMDFAADIIDSAMKDMARAEIRAKAKLEKQQAAGKDRMKDIDKRAREQLRDHRALSARASELLAQQWDSLAGCLAHMFPDRPKQFYKQSLLNCRAAKSRNRYVRINPHRIGFPQLKEMMQFPVLRIKRVDAKDGTVLLHTPVRGCTIIEEISRREHPLGSLALRTIGVAREDSATRVVDGHRTVVPVNIKLGVEGAFDQYLSGEDGVSMMQSISGIARIPVPSPDNREPVHGIDVVTTIDVELQDVAERELRNQLETQRAEWGCVVLMEVATGEIHAMSNLTRYPSGRIADDLNYAIGRNMEPGSTFKLATLIALLDDAGMSLDDKIDTEGGRAVVGRAMVVDDHKEGVLSLKKVFELSSNIGFSKSVHGHYAADPARFVDFVCNMGLDKPLHVQIPGSLAPVIRHPGDRYWTRGMTLEKMAYGYTFEITPMRTLCLYNAVANGGRMISPVLVTELRRYGQTVRTFATQTVNERICTPKTLGYIRESLEGVVDEGTAKALGNKYYKVAAKTGTAQVASGNRGYVDHRYIATMVGYFPADNPKYSCIVAIQTTAANYYGASLSGPVFKAVADRVFASHVDWHPGISEGRQAVKEPVEIKGGRTDDMERVASKLGLPLRGGRQAGEWARSETDSARAELTPVEVIPGRVPQVTGMGLKEALYLMEKAGLRVAVSGKGKVASQSVPAGGKAVRGQVVVLRCSQ